MQQALVSAHRLSDALGPIDFLPAIDISRSPQRPQLIHAAVQLNVIVILLVSEAIAFLRVIYVQIADSRGPALLR